MRLQQSTEPVDLDAEWRAFRRQRPDPAAPNVPSMPVRLLYSLLLIPTLALTLFAVLPYCTIRYLVVGPPLKWQPFRTYIEGRLVYWSGRLLDAAYLRPPPAGGKIPANLPLKWAIDGRKNVDCQVVELDPIGLEMQKGVGRVEGVTGEKRWGYMLTPPTSLGQGLGMASPGEKAILYFHGGSYAGGHPVKIPFPWQNAKALKCRLLGVQYRLCTSSSTAFPAPILDALAGYLYLTRTLGFNPLDVILLGDSSGGHLALCLSRYISDIGIPHPGYIASTSPLGDCSRSMPTRKTLRGIDILASNMDAKPLKSALRYYTPEAIATNPYFCPARADAKDWLYLKDNRVKVYIMLGTKEILRDDGLGIVKGMKEAGVDVFHREDEGGNHCGAMAQWKGSSAWDVWQADLNRIINS